MMTDGLTYCKVLIPYTRKPDGLRHLLQYAMDFVIMYKSVRWEGEGHINTCSVYFILSISSPVTSFLSPRIPSTSERRLERYED